jgi:hypothetical protein
VDIFMSRSDDTPLQPTTVLVRCSKCGELYAHTTAGCFHCTVEVDVSSVPITQQIDRLPTAIRMLASPQDTLDSDCQILLQFLPSALCIPVTLDEPVVLGRLASLSQTRPYDLLDLSHLGAEKRGVSRQHCQLERQGAHLYITDLNSTNGTYLNGTRLTAYTPYRLADGDRLILSTLHCTVVFVTASVA